MIDHSDIRLGVRAVLLAITDSNMPTIANMAWENRSFTPTEGTPWLRETLMSGAERQVASGTLRGTGIIQYDLFWPAGTGTEDPDNLIDVIKNAFKPVTMIGTHSSIWRAERLSGITDEKWYMVSAHLSYRAHAIEQAA